MRFSPSLQSIHFHMQTAAFSTLWQAEANIFHVYNFVLDSTFWLLLLLL